MRGVIRLGVALVAVAVTTAPAALAGAAEPLRTTDGTKVSDRAWDRVHGVVEAVSGRTMTLRTDDGRFMSVNLTVVNPIVRAVLAPGDNVTVMGSVGRHRATAQYIRPDDAVQASPRTEPKN